MKGIGIFILFILLLAGLYSRIEEGGFEDFIDELEDVQEEGWFKDIILDFRTDYALETKSINELSCEKDIKNRVRNKELTNASGSTSTILKVKNVTEQSKTNKSITCVGVAVFDNAEEAILLMTVYEDTDGVIMFQFEAYF